MWKLSNSYFFFPSGFWRSLACPICVTWFKFLKLGQKTSDERQQKDSLFLQFCESTKDKNEKNPFYSNVQCMNTTLLCCIKVTCRKAQKLLTNLRVMDWYYLNYTETITNYMLDRKNDSLLIHHRYIISVGSWPGHGFNPKQDQFKTKWLSLCSWANFPKLKAMVHWWI